MTHILVLLGFSEDASNAIDFARKLFEKIPTTFHLLSVYENSPKYEHLGEWLDSLAEGALIDSKKRLKNLNKDNKNPRHFFKIHSKPSPLYRAIDEIREEHDTDILLMPINGKKGPKEIFLSSDTTEIIDRFRGLPIIVIPGITKIKKPKQIVFSTNFKRAFNRRELELLLLLGRSLPCQIRVVQIMGDNSLNDFQKVNKEYLVDIFEGIDFIFEKIKVKNTEIASINDYVREMESDMVSMINHRHNFLQKLLRENVIKKAVFNSTAPLLIMPELVRATTKVK